MKENPGGSLAKVCCFPVFPRRKKLLFLALASCLGVFLTWQRMTKYRFLRANFIPLSGLMAPALRSDLSEGQIYVTSKEQGILVPKGGCIWDIGANDGVWNSNSFYLINYLNYSAVLFEPEAEVFLSLRRLYATADSPFAGRVELYNMALLKSADVMEYRVFPASLESTLVKTRRQYDPQPDYRYHVAGADARMVCDQQKEYLKTGRCGETNSQTFSVLSIDAEGSDRSIFSRIHELGCSFDLVIIEAAGEDLVEAMRLMGYTVVLRSGYNLIFNLHPVCP